MAPWYCCNKHQSCPSHVDPKNPTTRFPACQFLACSHFFCPKCLVVSIEVDEVSPSFVRVEELRGGDSYAEIRKREEKARMKRALEEKVERERKRYKIVLEGGRDRDGTIGVERVVVDGRAREVIVIE